MARRSWPDAAPRAASACRPDRAGPRADRAISPYRGARASGVLAIVTLKRRAEFQRVRGGARHSTAAFLLECKPRAVGEGGDPGPRFGFTITKKIGNAVTRNRIRRRLKAALAGLASGTARAGMDYVIVARPASHDCAFGDLVRDLETAFARTSKKRS